MTVEELLMPRYKVIADYFHSPYELGDYLEKVTDVRFIVTKHCSTQTLAHIETLNKMPHLFKELEWWEERESSDMPMYLKLTDMVDGKDDPIHDVVLKVIKHFSAGNGEWRDDSYRIFCADSYMTPTLKRTSYNYIGWIPATEQQYNDYINSKSNAKP